MAMDMIEKKLIKSRINRAKGPDLISMTIMGIEEDSISNEKIRFLRLIGKFKNKKPGL
jgi:hypothetical protein